MESFKVLMVLGLIVSFVYCSYDSTINIFQDVFKHLSNLMPNTDEALVDDEVNILQEYDFVIVGSGSGGSVLANRLTEISGWNILLLEAGKDEMFLTDIPLMSPVMHITAYNWGYKTEQGLPDESNGNAGFCLAMENYRCNWPRGKAVGGTSVINYMMYTRGSKADYDSWEAQGNFGWSYKDVLPYFLKSENNKIEGLDERYHAKGGYLDVSYSPYVSKLSKVFLKAGEEMGYKLNDYNSDKLLGFSIAQANLRHGRRVSASKAFLRPIRTRSNLHISKLSRVTKIVIDGDKKIARGVKFIKNKKQYFVKASKEVILSAGSLNSPHLLMLSGIGPKNHLKSHGIQIIEDLPVGQNLQDHVSMSALTFLVNESVTIVESRIASNLANTFDYFLEGTGPLTVPGGAEGIAFLNTKRPDLTTEMKKIMRNSKQYKTGLFEKENLVIDDDKEIKFLNHSIVHDDYSDIEIIMGLGALTGDTSGSVRSMLGIREEFAKEVFAGYEGMDGFSLVPILMHPKSRGKVTLKSSNPFHWPILEANYYQHQDDLDTMVRGIKKAIALASTKSFKRYNATLLPVSFPGCRHIEFNTDSYWACVSRQVSTTLGHFVGTCKMAPRNNFGVVDNRLRVYGVQKLRVVDASIMPTIISGHTNAPTYMIGEKASDMIKQDWKKSIEQ